MAHCRLRQDKVVHSPYGVVAQMMRRILVDQARARLAVKRGASTVNVSLASLTERSRRGASAHL